MNASAVTAATLATKSDAKENPVRSVFDAVAKLIVARDIQDPVAWVNAVCPQNQIAAALMEAFPSDPRLWGDGFVIVRSETGPRGWCHPADDVDCDADTAGEAATEITPANLVAADTPVLDLVRHIAASEQARSPLFVLDGVAISGVVTANDLRKPLFRLCLMALLFELEDACLDLATRHAKETWAALSSPRKSQARRTAKKRLGKEPLQHERLLLSFTMFSDKATMLEGLRDNGPSLAATRLRDFEAAHHVSIEAVVEKCELVRNWCAHTGREDEIPKAAGTAGDLSVLIAEARGLMKACLPVEL